MTGLEVCSLTKRFGSHTVLDGVDVRFAPGAVTALLGPNGAGKTTLLKSVLGLVRPTNGAVRIDGHQIDEHGAYRQAIGYMPQLPNFPPHMTGRELTDMLDDLRDYTDTPDDDLLLRFHLEGELDKPFRALSGGTRQKVNAALAFRYRTPILILDEPTAGLDPVASLALKAKVRACRAEGRTVVITSHNLGDLEALADAVVFLNEGRVRFDGSIGRLLDDTGHGTLEEAIAALMVDPEALHPSPDTPDEGTTPAHMEIVR